MEVKKRAFVAGRHFCTDVFDVFTSNGNAYRHSFRVFQGGNRNENTGDVLDRVQVERLVGIGDPNSEARKKLEQTSAFRVKLCC